MNLQIRKANASDAGNLFRLNEEFNVKGTIGLEQLRDSIINDEIMYRKRI